METHPVLHEFGQAKYIDCTDGRLRDRGRARIPAGFSSVDWTGGRAVTSGHWSLGAGGRPWHTPRQLIASQPGAGQPALPARKRGNENSESNGLGKQKGCREARQTVKRHVGWEKRKAPPRTLGWAGEPNCLITERIRREVYARSHDSQIPIR